MSDAQVQFSKKDYQPANAGEEVFFSFQCPSSRRCGGLMIKGKLPHVKHDRNNKNGGVAQWEWNGNRDKPTFSPSIHCKGCWHGYIEDGRCVNTAHQDEP